MDSGSSTLLVGNSAFALLTWWATEIRIFDKIKKFFKPAFFDFCFRPQN